MRSRFRFPMASFRPSVALTAAAVLVPLLLSVASRSARAQQTVAQNAAATNYAMGIFGQSVTTAAGGSFNNLVFNFYTGNAGDVVNLIPYAPGTIYLLSQEYTGPFSALSSSSPGYIASVAGSGGFFTFASSVTLQGGTQYFFYDDTNTTIAESSGNAYAGGVEYAPTSGGNAPYTSQGQYDATFLLRGTRVAAAAPEPSTLPLLGMGLISSAGLVGVARRRKNNNPVTPTA